MDDAGRYHVATTLTSKSRIPFYNFSHIRLCLFILFWIEKVYVKHKLSVKSI